MGFVVLFKWVVDLRYVRLWGLCIQLFDISRQGSILTSEVFTREN